jgi:hypothetical protein
LDGKRYRKSTKKTKKTAAVVVEASLLARLPEIDGAVSAPELEPLRTAINQRNQRKKFGQVLENAS